MRVSFFFCGLLAFSLKAFAFDCPTLSPSDFERVTPSHILQAGGKDWHLRYLSKVHHGSIGGSILFVAALKDIRKANQIELLEKMDGKGCRYLVKNPKIEEEIEIIMYQLGS